MLLCELKDEVASLGFSQITATDTAFLSAANRALRLLFAERGETASVRILAASPGRIFRLPFYRHAGGEVDTFPLSGKAYSFRASGKGRFTLRTGGEETATDFDTKGALFRGFLGEGAEIVFSGDYLYTVYDLSTYSDVLSDSESAIPAPDGRVEYRMEDFAPDFLAFDREPTDGEGKHIPGLILSDGAVSLPAGFCGQVDLSYRRAPKTIAAENDFQPIDVSRECEALLPLLVASYLWLDDDPEKAQYYLALYREAMAGIRRSDPRRIDAHYENATGW